MNTTYTLSMDFEYDKIVSTNTVGYGIVVTGEEDLREFSNYVGSIITSCMKNTTCTLEKIYFTLFKNSDEVLLEGVNSPSTYYVPQFVSNAIQKVKEDKEQFLIEEIETDESTE